MKNYYRLIIVGFILLMVSSEVYSESVYTSEELYIIPWGYNTGELSLWWKEPDPPDPPDGYMKDAPFPSAISPTGGFVIADSYDDDISHLTKYSIDGVFISQIDFEVAGLPGADEMTLANSGEVLMICQTELYLLDSSLQLVSTTEINTYSSSVWPSNNGFWCLYTIGSWGSNDCEDYLFEYFTDGSKSDPVLLFSGLRDDPARVIPRFISPDGQLFNRVTDMYGYNYYIERLKVDNSFACRLTKYNPQGDIHYVYDSYSIDDWANNEIFPTWSGDYYTQHGNSQGIVLTKYDLHVDPVCNLVVVTPLPHTGPSPVAIEFVANAFDDDGDALTYHWDFDGDTVFDEPVDDAYTGTAENPTHEYTADYEGPVCLKVTDNYQGECVICVIMSVDVE